MTRFNHIAIISTVLGFFLAGAGSPQNVTQIKDSKSQIYVEESLNRALDSGRIKGLPETLKVTEVTATQSPRLQAIKTEDIAIHDPAEDLAAFYTELSQDLPISEGVNIHLSLPKSEYLLGEPVIVQATLENISKRPIQIAPLLDPQFQYAHYIITTPAGKKLGFSPVALACSRGNLQVETLFPNETRSESIPLFFHKQGWIFTEPGTYTLTVTFRGTTSDSLRIEGNTITFNVVEGSPVDMAAAEIIMGHSQGLFLTWNQGDHLEKGIAAMEELLANYPESQLALYAAYALGSNQAQNFWDGRFQGTIRPANPQKAVEYLAPLANRLDQKNAPVLPHSMIQGTYLTLADAYQSLGQLDASKDTLRRLNARYGQNL